MTAQSEQCRRLMEEAITQRSRCFLSLPETATGLGELNCTILEVTDKGIMLESTVKTAAGPLWVGLPVTGYFRLILERETLDEVFYTFRSRILAATAGPSGQARLRLAEPESMVLGQRRKSLRVAPDPVRLRQAFFWRYDSQKGFDFDVPSLRASDFQNDQARLTNISAGGLRLTMNLALARERGLDLAKGHRLVLHLEFIEPRVAGRHEFWLVAKVRHTALDKTRQDLALGMEFLASGVLDATAAKIRWQPVPDNVIPSLSNIFFLWDLDRHREKVG